MLLGKRIEIDVDGSEFVEVRLLCWWRGVVAVYWGKAMVGAEAMKMWRRYASRGNCRFDKHLAIGTFATEVRSGTPLYDVSCGTYRKHISISIICK